MGLLDLLLVAVGLSMDAFAVSVCKGLNTKMHPVKTGLGRAIFLVSLLCNAILTAVSFALQIDRKSVV